MKTMSDMKNQPMRTQKNYGNNHQMMQTGKLNPYLLN
jgi:hypothetical protein